MADSAPSFWVFNRGYAIGLLIGCAIGVAVTATVLDTTPVVAPPSVVVLCSSEATYTPAPYVKLATEAAAMLRRNEGERAAVYEDHTGNPTVGVGFNLTRPDADARLVAVGSKKDALQRGGKLSAAQIDTLLARDIADCIADLEQLVPTFAALPLKAQLALVDLRFNCGPGGLRTFVNTLRSIKTARWGEAAERLAMSQWASQVGDRAVRTIALLRGIS